MNQNRIKGKLVLITGASAGIGEAAAQKFAEYGANLILAARRTGKMEALAARLAENHGIKAGVRKLDVRDKEAVLELGQDLEKNGLIPDILINNAGLSAGKDPIHTANIEDWEVMIDTNIKGMLYVSRAILPLMVKRNSGHIIYLGSLAGEQVYPGGNVYNATKFAVKAIARATNIDLVDTAIRVTNIAPGAVKTEFSDVRFKGDMDKVNAVYEGFTPLCADDIADCMVYVTNTPEHINVQYMLVTPTAQRASHIVGRNTSR